MVIVAEVTAPHVSRWMVAEDLHLRVERVLAFYRVPARFPSRAWQCICKTLPMLNLPLHSCLLLHQSQYAKPFPQGVLAWKTGLSGSESCWVGAIKLQEYSTDHCPKRHY